ncbi:MAG: porin family protein [Phaeodactylibacter sp.]|uniref:porin family protein n=1 Tax=Phaeodactylibacter sp. TaxID=1940289 RepID=UPI0032EEA2CD
MTQKLILLGIVCFLFMGTLSAQSIDRRESFELGIKAGLNVSNVWDSKGEAFTADPKAGFAGGVFFGIPIGKYLGVQPEVLISQKGFKGSGTLLGSPYSTKRTTTYLDIPLQVQLKPVPFITILAGPQFSYLLKQKDSYSFGGNSTEQEQEFTNDNVRENILGFVAGADFIYGHVVLSGRAGWDFQTNNGDGTSLTPRYKNQWLQFTLGVKL